MGSIYRENNSGARTDPWGTPQVRRAEVNKNWPRLSVKHLFDKQDLNYWGSSRYILAKFSRALKLFWVSPRHSSMDVIFCLSDSGVMNSDLDWCKRGLQFLQCCPWVFVTSWMSPYYALGGIFRRSTTCGKVWHCARFFPFGDNGSHWFFGIQEPLK